MEPHMTFRITALDYTPFAHLFDLSDAELAAQEARRVTAQSSPGYPCRVSLQDAAVGETLILTNFRNLDTASPYAASHAIYVRQDAASADPRPGEIPDVLARRLLSVRGFDTAGMMQEADVVQGTALDAALSRVFTNADVAFVDIHNAKKGCFAARAVRA